MNVDHQDLELHCWQGIVNLLQRVDQTVDRQLVDINEKSLIVDDRKMAEVQQNPQVHNDILEVWVNQNIDN